MTTPTLCICRRDLLKLISALSFVAAVPAHSASGGNGKVRFIYTGCSIGPNSPISVRGGDLTVRKMDDGQKENCTAHQEVAEKGQASGYQFVIGGGAINEKRRVHSKNFGVDQSSDIVSTDSSHFSYAEANNELRGVRKEDKSDANIHRESAQSQFDPKKHVSHTLHALAGLDRYPNYLSRWYPSDIDKLEDALEAQLNEVRRQKREIGERREGIARLLRRAVEMENANKSAEGGDWIALLDAPQTWQEVRDKVLDPVASKAVFNSKFFKRKTPPSIADVLSGKIAVELDPAFLEEWMDQEMFDVYSFPLLSNEFCAKLKATVRRLVSLGEAEEFSSLNLGHRPVDLDTIGLGWVNDLLFHLVMRPISRLLYKDTESIDELDWRQGYVAGYSHNPSAKTGATRHRLVSHTDDSEVTMNLCIGDDFEGGSLQFRGLRGTNEEGELIGEFQPRLGTALLHAGRHLHAVTEVKSGDRYAYIIWARSWNGVRAQTCPCCWLNRRQESKVPGPTCICGPRWN